MNKYAPEIPFDRPDEEMESQVPERFEVRDEQSANWVVRRVSQGEMQGRSGIFKPALLKGMGWPSSISPK